MTEPLLPTQEDPPDRGPHAPPRLDGLYWLLAGLCLCALAAGVALAGAPGVGATIAITGIAAAGVGTRRARGPR